MPPPDAAPPAVVYAPYVATWGWGSGAFRDLVELRARTGLGRVTLAFVLAEGGCAASGEIKRRMGDVAAFRRAGGKVRASFGGARGRSLEVACADAAALAGALRAFVAETGIDDLDLDVEQPEAMTPAVSQRRAEALAALQKERGVRVSVTLGATPSGLSAPGLAVLAALVKAGVTVAHVNLLTMRFGAPGRGVAELAVAALTEAHAQLRALLPSLTEAAAWSMLGATPMIGESGLPGEAFSLADARALVAFARRKHLGLLSYWAMHRDQPGSGPLAQASRAQSHAFAFHEILATAAR